MDGTGGLSVVEQIADLIEENQRFLISTHLSPDGDAIGSQLALKGLLDQLGKVVVLINADRTPKRFSFLKGIDEILQPDGKLHEEIDEIDVWFVVDCGDIDRVGEDVLKLVGEGKRVVNIDHHSDNTRFGDLNWVVRLSSTAEAIHEFSRFLAVKLTPEIATALYTGIVFDTGSFRNANTRARVFRRCAELLECGVDARQIVIHLYEQERFEKFTLLGEVLKGIRRSETGIVWGSVTQDLLTRTQTTMEDTIGIIETLRTIVRTEVAILFKELDRGEVKVSFRSKGGLDVDVIAHRFGGGGHAKAAGCKIEGELHEVESRVLEEVERRLRGEIPPEAGTDAPRSRG
ncbi:MAG: bifunctional oligoribonuclease/PAP phosphatase NrnA [Candidatus Bipolaricaulia bacterium]